MKAIKVLLIIIWTFSMQFTHVQAQQFSVKTYKLTINGTSSMHDWESSVENLECTGSLKVTNNTLSDLSNVVVKIPVKSIKSTKGKMMDNKTWEAFNHGKNPTIIFKLTDEKINAATKSMEATGTLSMAGVTKAIDISLTYKTLSPGELQIAGSKKLKMTDFKMEPPTAMMGAIKVGDDVEVSFELILALDQNTL